ncbi:MAG: hypothetical protein K1X57_16735 [Gemmataceae bacterium]|nr:hypothetical protein [Gemmataceae bacterium]
MAVRSARWADGAPAIVGPLDGAGLDLLVDKPGERVLELDWSAALRPAPGGLLCELRWPGAPIATMEFDLPADWQPVAPADSALIAGPRPGSATDRRLWTINGGGLDSIPLLLIRVDSAAPLVVARHHTQLDAGPAWVEVNCAVTIEARGRFRELIVEGDLPIADVTGDKLARWEARGRQTILTFREPVDSTLIEIRGTMTPTDDRTIVVPDWRVRGAIVAGETIEVKVPPALSLGDWNSGAFAVTESRFTPAGRQTVTLQSAWHTAAGGRPSFRVGPAGSMPDVVEKSHWQIEPDRQSLRVDWSLRPNRGSLANWAVALPAGWKVDTVECAGHETRSTQKSAAGKTTWTIEFDPPLPTGRPTALSASLHAGPPRTTQPLPELAPAASRSRIAELNIKLSPVLEVRGLPAPLSRSLPEIVGPSAEPAPDARLAFPNGTVEGSLLVRFRPVRLDADVATTVRVERDHFAVRDVATVTPVGPPTESLWLWSASDDGHSVAWQTTPRQRDVQRIDPALRVAQLLAARSPVSAALAAIPGTAVRVSFDRPIADRVRIERELQQRAVNSLALPQWHVLGARESRPAVTLVDPTAAAELSTSPERARVHRVTPASPEVHLDDVRMDVIGEGDQLQCTFRAVFGVAQPGRLAYELPAGATLLEAKVGGRVVPTDPRGLPVPDDAPGHGLSLTYRLPVNYGWLLGQLSAPPPRFGSGDAPVPAYQWRLHQRSIVSGSGESVWVVSVTRLIGACLALALVLTGVFIGLRPRRGVVPRPVLVPTLLLALVWPGFAGGPEPTTVYIVATADGETAYAPRELLDRLAALARPLPGATAVVTVADYAATVEANAVRVVGRVTVHALAADARADWPVGGALDDVRVDGQPAFPVIEGERLRLTFAKPGPHEVEIRFTVPVAVTAGECSARWPGPDVWSATLDAKLPAGANWTVPPPARGTMTMLADRITADLGRSAGVTLRWRAAEAPPVAVTRWRAGWIWDLARPAARLDGIIRGTIAPGAARDLVVTLPATVEPIAVQSLEGQPLADWSMKERKLTVRFAVDAVGPVILAVKAVPRSPLVAEAALPVPVVAGAEMAWAWHAPVGDVAAGATTGVTPIDPEQFIADYWGTPRGDAPPMPTRAYQKTTGAVQIRIARPTNAAWRGTADIHWRLSPRRVELTATADLNVEHAPQAMLAWDLPAGLTVNAVAGPHVIDWSRSEQRLFVWFDRPLAAAQVAVYATAPRGPEQARWDVPTVRLVDAGPKTTVRLMLRPGWELLPLLAQNLTPIADPAGMTGGTFRVDRADYKLAVQARPSAPAMEWRARTHINHEADRWSAATTIEAKARRGDVRSFGLRVRAAAGDDVVIDAPGATVIERPVAFGIRSWRIEVPPGAGDAFTMSIRAAGRGPTWAVPLPVIDMSEQKPALVEHRITTGRRVAVRDEAGLTPDADGWKVTADDARLTVE